MAPNLDQPKSPAMTSGRLAIREAQSPGTAPNTPRTLSPNIRSLHSLANSPLRSQETIPLLQTQQQIYGREMAESTPFNINVDTDATPELIAWIIPALLCAFAYALYNIFIKKGSDSIHPVMGGVILQIVAALLGICLMGVIAWNDGGMKQLLDYDSSGIFWSIMAGCAVGIAEMLSFFVMGMGVQAMQAVPIIIGGSVMFGTIIGYQFLQEVLSLQGWAGVILLVIGICMVATDPGTSAR
mmetsp:Transcript_2155/g.3101  ORF Transcript_2155/g.3101 Transcript_2155/m.3101 type:complete len:241 (-) Transcript_2155:198-920(-)|eukprot:CAMPEP_0178910826 /NCGR_PEP_ID=MMETSP0786-20121207/9318_1 /TAXON_ID=186022 /ORGANISM="Thalassionema frauenfeldii, Strain CCMP 1798" /LENGTH=240 /DNA_ID=CAMNT_0020583131 /DNA_START=47 /DNA_END=769 /DNA_ORIENTATION=+